MMTFKQFLSEEEMIEVGKMLKRDCAPFLREIKGNGFLHRGIKHFHYTGTALDLDGKELKYGVKTVRQDRKPLDFTKQRSKILDDWFYNQFGIHARTQCVFAAGEQTTLNDLKFYGTPCIIFPIGEFKYVWSPRVQDLYGDINIGGAENGHSYTDDELVQKLEKWLTEKDYQTDGLDQAVKMRHEVMIQCDKYYAFLITHEDQLKASLEDDK